MSHCPVMQYEQCEREVVTFVGKNNPVLSDGEMFPVLALSVCYVYKLLMICRLPFGNIDFSLMSVNIHTLGLCPFRVSLL